MPEQRFQTSALAGEAPRFGNNGAGDARARHEQMLRTMHEHQGRKGTTTRLAPCIHPDAEMSLLISFGHPLRGREAVLAAMEMGRQADIYLARVDRFHWLDDNTSLTSGQARYALEHGGIAQGKVHWLDQFKDGLIWRVRFFRSEAAAHEAYAN